MCSHQHLTKGIQMWSGLISSCLFLCMLFFCLVYFFHISTVIACVRVNRLMYTSNDHIFKYLQSMVIRKIPW